MKTWNRGVIALTLSLSILCVHSSLVLAAPAAGALRPAGELMVKGEVNLDGVKAISGVSLFSDSVVTTGADSHATISLAGHGRYELGPHSSLRLAFDGGSSKVLLDGGAVRVSVPENSSATVMTRDGAAVADSSQNNLFSVTVSGEQTEVATEAGRVEMKAARETRTVGAGEIIAFSGAAPATAAPQSGGNNLRGRTVGWILLAVGAAIVTTIIIIAADDDDDNTIPTPPNPSPTT